MTLRIEKCVAHGVFPYSKATSIEIEQLNARIVEAEVRLKTEVTRIKKKLQIQITELELSLDVANKTNIDLQKTIKKQSFTLTVRADRIRSFHCKSSRIAWINIRCLLGPRLRAINKIQWQLV
jgi:hypothetical protein